MNTIFTKKRTLNEMTEKDTSLHTPLMTTTNSFSKSLKQKTPLPKTVQLSATPKKASLTPSSSTSTGKLHKAGVTKCLGSASRIFKTSVSSSKPTTTLRSGITTSGSINAVRSPANTASTGRSVLSSKENKSNSYAHSQRPGSSASATSSTAVVNPPAPLSSSSGAGTRRKTSTTGSTPTATSIASALQQKQKQQDLQQRLSKRHEEHLRWNGRVAMGMSVAFQHTASMMVALEKRLRDQLASRELEFNAKHESAVAQVRFNADEEIAAIRSEHMTELDRVWARHSSRLAEIDQLNSDFTNRFAERDRTEADLRFQIQAHKQSEAELRCHLEMVRQELVAAKRTWNVDDRIKKLNAELDSRGFELEMRLKDLEEARATSRKLQLTLECAADKDKELKRRDQRINDIIFDLERQLAISKELRIQMDQYKMNWERSERDRDQLQRRCEELEFRLDTANSAAGPQASSPFSAIANSATPHFLGGAGSAGAFTLPGSASGMAQSDYFCPPNRCLERRRPSSVFSRSGPSISLPGSNPSDGPKKCSGNITTPRTYRCSVSGGGRSYTSVAGSGDNRPKNIVPIVASANQRFHRQNEQQQQAAGHHGNQILENGSHDNEDDLGNNVQRLRLPTATLMTGHGGFDVGDPSRGGGGSGVEVSSPWSHPSSAPSSFISTALASPSSFIASASSKSSDFTNNIGYFDGAIAPPPMKIIPSTVESPKGLGMSISFHPSSFVDANSLEVPTELTAANESNTPLLALPSHQPSSIIPYHSTSVSSSCSSLLPIYRRAVGNSNAAAAATNQTRSTVSVSFVRSSFDESSSSQSFSNSSIATPPTTGTTTTPTAPNVGTSIFPPLTLPTPLGSSTIATLAESIARIYTPDGVYELLSNGTDNSNDENESYGDHYDYSGVKKDAEGLTEFTLSNRQQQKLDELMEAREVVKGVGSETEGRTSDRSHILGEDPKVVPPLTAVLGSGEAVGVDAGNDDDADTTLTD